MRKLATFLIVFGTCLAAARAEQGMSLAQRQLQQIVDQQKQLFDSIAKQGDHIDMEAFRSQAQSIAHSYDMLLADNQKFAPAYASYGYFLRQVGMEKASIAMLLKANELDPDIPLVKNQIGNYLAEKGEPVEAAEYFLAAIKLAPDEPLYHYQLGTLLTAARDTFLKSGDWTRAALDKAMHDAFRRAAELAPDRFEFAYRYAESFYDLETPDWNGALQAWKTLELNAPTAIERETIQLHEANVYVNMGKPELARLMLSKVTEPKLDDEKRRIVALLEPTRRQLPLATQPATGSTP